jgi:hypothetical protein
MEKTPKDLQEKTSNKAKNNSNKKDNSKIVKFLEKFNAGVHINKFYKFIKSKVTNSEDAQTKKHNKAQKKAQKKQAKEKKLEQKKRNKQSKTNAKTTTKDFALDDLTLLEARVLRRKEDQKRKRKKILILSLTVFLVIALSMGSFTIYTSVRGGTEPIRLNINIQTDLETIYPEDHDPSEGRYSIYPGDTIDVNFYVSNVSSENLMPLFLRFRTYIVLDDVSEHSVFDEELYEQEKWYELKDEAGGTVYIDDWYYYGAFLEPGEENKIQILESLTLRTGVDSRYQGNDFTLVLAIETLEADMDALNSIESWYWVAPSAWVSYMSSLDIPVYEQEEQQEEQPQE